MAKNSVHFMTLPNPRERPKSWYLGGGGGWGCRVTRSYIVPRAAPPITFHKPNPSTWEFSTEVHAKPCYIGLSLEKNTNGKTEIGSRGTNLIISQASRALAPDIYIHLSILDVDKFTK